MPIGPDQRSDNHGHVYVQTADLLHYLIAFDVYTAMLLGDIGQLYPDVAVICPERK